MRNKWQKRAYERYKAQGLCVKCLKPVEPERAGMIECVNCAAKAGANTKARYERYKSEQRCVVCGKQDKNTLGGRTRCFDCAVKGADQHKAYRERSKAKKTARSGNSEAVNRKNA